MHEIQRNLLYEVKKEANKRDHPFYSSNSEEDDIRKENQKLRSKIRSQETEIIRLNSKIEDLMSKITILSSTVNTEHSWKEGKITSGLSNFSSVPMLLESKELKETNKILEEEILHLNGNNNELEAENRQIKSDMYALELRIKEFNILEKMREERFKDEVDRLTPIIIEEPGDYSHIKNALRQISDFLKSTLVEIVENLFLLGVKECEGNKKINSFTIFKNYWKEILTKKQFGFAAAVSSYSNTKKIVRMFDEQYGNFDLSEWETEGTIDEWVIGSIIEVQNKVESEEIKKLFRLLGLKYRCKFPIKGENHEINPDVLAYLEHSICEEVRKNLKSNKPK